MGRSGNENLELPGLTAVRRSGAEEIELARADRWDDEEISAYRAEGKSYLLCQGTCGKRYWLGPGTIKCAQCRRAEGWSLTPPGAPLPDDARQIFLPEDLNGRFSGTVLQRGSVFTEFVDLPDLLAHVASWRENGTQGDDRLRLIAKHGFAPNAFNPNHRYIGAPGARAEGFERPVIVEIAPASEPGFEETVVAVHDGALPAAACTRCSGDGRELVCCGNPFGDGECCNDPEMDRCGHCGGSGEEPDPVVSSVTPPPDYGDIPF
jgi:hypothetical protein